MHSAVRQLCVDYMVLIVLCQYNILWAVVAYWLMYWCSGIQHTILRSVQIYPPPKKKFFFPVLQGEGFHSLTSNGVNICAKSMDMQMQTLGKLLLFIHRCDGFLCYIPWFDCITLLEYMDWAVGTTGLIITSDGSCCVKISPILDWHIRLQVEHRKVPGSGGSVLRSCRFATRWSTRFSSKRCTALRHVVRQVVLSLARLSRSDGVI